MTGYAMRTLVAILGLTLAATDDGLKSHIDNHLIRQSVFYGLAATAVVETSRTSCGNHLARIVDEVNNRSRWAIKMMDASGMPKGGLHWGGTYWLGSQRQCEATGILKNIPVSPTLGPTTVETIKDLPPFPIAYFAAYFQHNSEIQAIIHFENEFRMTLGLCLPKSCEGPELKNLLQKYFDSKILLHQSIYNTTYQMEEVKKLVDDYSWLWQFKTITIGLIFAAAIIMCIVGTVFDVKYYQPIVKLRKSANVNNNVSENAENCKNYDLKDSKNISVQTDEAKKDKMYVPMDIGLGYRIIRSFSVYTNSRVIFSPYIAPDSISVIHGIRLFSMLYVILAHSILFMQEFFDNKVSPFYISDELSVQIFSQAGFSVDTFFCLSGYLLAYSFFQTEYGPAKKKKYNILERVNLLFFGIIKRFLRLTPSYMIMLGITDVVATWRFKVSPFWSNERNDLICPNYWWRNLLYINNLFPRSEMCMAWSWYLSNDLQFFIIASFFLILSTMYFKTAVTLMTTFFFGCMGFTVYMVYAMNFIPTLDELYMKREVFYDHPLVRVGPYIVGVYAAYLVYYLKKTLPFKRPVIWLLWIVGPAINIYILFGMTNRNVSLEASAAYMALSRILWAVGVAWVVIACETGNAGLLVDILSLKIWFPLSRLSFLAYLVNPVVIFLFVSYSDKAYQAEIPNVTFMSPGFMILTFIAAYVLCLLFESPNLAINKIFFDYVKNKHRRSVEMTNSMNSNGVSILNDNTKIPDDAASKN